MMPLPALSNYALFKSGLGYALTKTPVSSQ